MHATPPDTRDAARFFARVTPTPLADAFDVKRVMPPFAGARALEPHERSARWTAIRDARRSGKSLAYVHVPFCENHCLFCGFYQNAWRDSAGGAYVDSGIAHLRRDATRSYQSHGPVHALYFGGGTPSALAAPDLARLVRAARDCLPLAPDCEITFEGRVRSFTPEKVEAALTAGVNRFSIGVQTFDGPLRQSMGRKMPRDDVIRFVADLVATDAAAIVIDLMYGLPGQTPASWEQDVRTAVALGLDGVDLYSLSLVPGSPLRIAIDKGKFRPATRAELGAYYGLGSRLLADARWEPISTTHWRGSTRERNLYNIEIKRGAQCLAFGAGGSLAGHAYRIESDLAIYEAAIRDGGDALAHLSPQPAQHALVARIRGDMDRARLDLARLRADLAPLVAADAPAAATLVDPLLAQWEQAGLLVRDRDWADLTVAGRFWQVTMTQHLVDYVGAHLDARRPS